MRADFAGRTERRGGVWCTVVVFSVVASVAAGALGAVQPATGIPEEVVQLTQFGPALAVGVAALYQRRRTRELLRGAAGAGSGPRSLGGAVLLGAAGLIRAIVTPSLKGRGLAGETLKALRQLAADAGWPRVIAPVRPTLKARYPLTSIEAFMRWTRQDGMALDPWIRTHQRLGARILAAAPQSQTMTGTIAEWERWTSMVFPETDCYVIPEGLSLLQLDRSADLGT
ncbi:hypothetical protein ACGFX8_30310 [Streptomyces sp. NPDC048362]|uniref:hypothetical protein n=1 Tax=Streptomyces sp. NPDC048362 TaxID=3365539 RepID=UPI0037150C41